MAEITNSFSDQGNWHSEVKSVDGSPLAGTLLTSRVHNLLQERLSIVIVVVHDITCDLNEKGIENALVPCGQDVSHLLVGETKTALHDVVGLAGVLVLVELRICSKMAILLRSAACHRTRYRCGPS